MATIIDLVPLLEIRAEIEKNEELVKDFSDERIKYWTIEDLAEHFKHTDELRYWLKTSIQVIRELP